MKNLLSTIKGKVIAGAITLAVIAAAVVVIVLLNTGYRTIRVDDLNGTTEITMGDSVKEAVKGQNLKSGCDVFVEEESDLTLELDEDKHVFADELTSFSLEAVGKPGKDSRTVIKLDEGSVLSEIDEKLGADESYVVESPNATMAVRGTTFTVTVSYDEEGLCHTIVEVEDGTVEVTKKDENGNPTDEVETLEAGEKTEVISLVINRDEDDDNPSGGDFPPDDDFPPEDMGFVYQDPEALAVENAIEAYINGGELDTTNFERVTDLEIYGRIVFVTLDYNFVGKGEISNSAYSNETAEISYDPGSGEMIEISSSNNTLTNLDFLAEMTNIRQLTAVCGKVTDITSIGKLSELSSLDLTYNEISDIPPLNNLTNLTKIDLSYNQISDVSAFKGMISLNSLDLDSNQISDVSPLKDISQLESLIISGNQISDISPLKNLTNLTHLSLNENKISDISPLKDLTNLTSLYFNFNNVSDLSPISGLTNLNKLDISVNEFSDISPIANLHKLNDITIYSNLVKDYSPLYGLTNLKFISLYKTVDENEVAKLQKALPETKIIQH